MQGIDFKVSVKAVCCVWSSINIELLIYIFIIKKKKTNENKNFADTSFI